MKICRLSCAGRPFSGKCKKLASLLILKIYYSTLLHNAFEAEKAIDHPSIENDNVTYAAPRNIRQQFFWCISLFVKLSLLINKMAEVKTA